LRTASSKWFPATWGELASLFEGAFLDNPLLFRLSMSEAEDDGDSPTKATIMSQTNKNIKRRMSHDMIAG